MPTATPKTTPPPSPPAVAAPIPMIAGPQLPWIVPTWPVALACGLYAMTFWILWMLAPAKGQAPSELFKLLAQAIVLTAFVNGVVGAVYTASRDSQKKTDTIAAQAQAIVAAQASPPTP